MDDIERRIRDTNVRDSIVQSLMILRDTPKGWYMKYHEGEYERGQEVDDDAVILAAKFISMIDEEGSPLNLFSLEPYPTGGVTVSWYAISKNDDIFPISWVVTLLNGGSAKCLIYNEKHHQNVLLEHYDPATEASLEEIKHNIKVWHRSGEEEVSITAISKAKADKDSLDDFTKMMFLDSGWHAFGDDKYDGIEPPSSNVMLLAIKFVEMLYARGVVPVIRPALEDGGITITQFGEEDSKTPEMTWGFSIGNDETASVGIYRGDPLWIEQTRFFERCTFKDVEEAVDFIASQGLI